MLDIAFAKPGLPRSGGLVLLMGEDTAPTPFRQQADEATGGAVTRGLRIAEFKGGKSKTCLMLAPHWTADAGGASRVMAIGWGKSAELSAHGLEALGGAAVAALGQEALVSIDATGLAGAQAAHVAMGAVLRAWRFDRYRTKEKPDDKSRLDKVVILTEAIPAARAEWDRLRAVAHGVLLARELVAEPANVLTPSEMARRCEALTSLGVKVEVLGPKELGKLGFGALLGVAQGSAEEPRVVVMEWNGEPREKGRKSKARPIAFVGKGVTFDTGGISIKPAGGMEDMKWDMAGAGAVIGLMAALAGRKARANVVGLVGLVENMPSATAQRPGDVVTSLSGQTIEVINTDAEGRLVLADVLWHCQREYDPVFMVDLATLTGAIVVGLGHEHAGLFSNDDELAQRLLAAGRETGEKLWRMPLDEGYDALLKSDIADMKNVGGRPGGACSAAQFIQRFVNDKPWAHLDIAGMAWSSKDHPGTPKGATAFGVRLLDRLVAEHYEAT